MSAPQAPFKDPPPPKDPTPPEVLQLEALSRIEALLKAILSALKGDRR